MQIIRLKAKDFEILGSNSLEGKLLSGKFNPNDNELTIEFEQTSIEWKEKNGGPELYLIPEHVPLCLVQSVLYLIGLGYRIKVTEIIV